MAEESLIRFNGSFELSPDPHQRQLVQVVLPQSVIPCMKTHFVSLRLETTDDFRKSGGNPGRWKESTIVGASPAAHGL